MTYATRLIFLSMMTLPLALGACADHRTTEEKFEDAADDLKEGRGIGNAMEELQDRSAGERLGDAIEDFGQDIERKSH